jgi:diguanylate cyclase (GGDEF)-like protein
MGGRILVVDDDQAVRAVVVDALYEAGFDAIHARDGFEAIRIARERAPDLVVLDVMMPFISGDDVYHALRSEHATRYVPVIFLTGQGSTREKARRLLAGADDYITKPFEMEELVARVSAVLRRSTELRALNPLSGLPGNSDITREITQCLATEGTACLYVDLDNFKTFNDHYGFTRGDDLIVLLGKLLLECVGSVREATFVGHVGGDDFVVLVPETVAEDVAREIVKCFDERVRSLYDEVDRERGHVIRTDRQGVERQLPFVTVSIGIVPVTSGRFADAVAVSRAAAEVKELAKRRDASSWAVDRRRASEPSVITPA